MTPMEALQAAVKKHGVRGTAREAGVSPTFVSLVLNGRVPVPLTGKLAEYLGIRVVTKVTVRR